MAFPTQEQVNYAAFKCFATAHTQLGISNGQRDLLLTFPSTREATSSRAVVALSNFWKLFNLSLFRVLDESRQNFSLIGNGKRV
jgi:hypothetical protein